MAQHARQQEVQPALAAAAPASSSDASSSAGLEVASVPLPPPPVVTLDAELEPLLLSKAAQVLRPALLFSFNTPLLRPAFVRRNLC